MLITTKELAARVGRSPQTIREWAAGGRIPAKRPRGGQWLFDEREVIDSMDRPAITGDQRTVADAKAIMAARIAGMKRLDQKARRGNQPRRNTKPSQGTD